MSMLINPYMFGAGGVGPTPPPVLGATYWLDANQETGYNDEDAVNPIVDWSGNNNDISQAASGQRSKYDTSQSNGRPAYRFDGTDDFMDIPTGVADTAWTLYVVLKPATVNNSSNRTIIGPNQVNGIQLRINSAHKLEIVESATAVRHTSTAALSTSNYQLLTVVRNNTSGEVRINGVQDSTFGAFGPYSGFARLAYANTGGPSEQYDGWISELVLYSTKHSGGDVTSVEGWALANHNL